MSSTASPPASGDSSPSSPSPSASSPSSSPSSLSPHHPGSGVSGSRRVRVYHLESGGTWLDLGIGWVFIGAEVPVQAQDQEHVAHLVIQEDVGADHSHAPLGALGLPSLANPTLLTVHIPHASGFGRQEQTIITFTMPLEAGSPLARHLMKRSAGSAETPAASPPPINGTIDIALSFKIESDAVEVWQYIHTFPEVVLEEQEESERQALEDDQGDQDEVDAAAESAVAVDAPQGRLLSVGVSPPGGPREEQQSSPRTMSLLSEEQMDDAPCTMQPIAQPRPTGWPTNSEDDMDELSEPTVDEQEQWSQQQPGEQTEANAEAESRHQAQQHQQPRFYSASGRPPPKGSSSSASGASARGSFDGDSNSSSSEDDGRPLVSPFRPLAGNVFSIRKGSDVKRAVRRAAEPPVHTPSESEVDEDDLIFPRSMRVPTMDNLERIVAHLTALVHPPLGAPPPASQQTVTTRGGRTRPVKHKAMMQATMTPFRRRQLLVTEITQKSIVYKRNLLIFSAKKPIAIRAQRTPSPAAGTAATPSVAPSAGTPVTAVTASSSASPAAASPPPAPVSSPDELNWLENLSTLLRQVDEEIAWREERMVERRLPLPIAEPPAESTADGAGLPPVGVPVPALSPETATLDELLHAASRIQESVSLLFSFNLQALLTYLFDVSSVHALYYQWFLVLTSYEYESAVDRRRKALADRQVDQANTSDLWRRHRTYLQSVVLKSPFPVQLTHILDLPAFDLALGSGDPALLAQLTAPPTRFCLLLLSSYFLPYVRDTLLYSPRALDDPIQMAMNQQVVFRNINLLMNGIIQDGDCSALVGPTAGGFGARKHANFRASAAAARNRKSTSVDETTPKWTKHVFARIRQLIEEEERQWEPRGRATDSLPEDSPIAVGSAADLASSPVPSSRHTPISSPPSSASATPVVSPGVYSLVSRLTKDWCPLLSMDFCSSLADWLYALHHLFALTKNANSANGVTQLQKDRLMTKMIDDGLLACIERVLLFCQRQQHRLQASGQHHSNVSSAIGVHADGTFPPLSASASVVGYSAETITWLRLLCLDFLGTLQSAQPGFMRRFMEAQVQHFNERTHADNGGHLLVPLAPDEEKTATDGQQDTQAAVSPPEPNKHWRLEHERCHAARRQFSSTIRSQSDSPASDSHEGHLPALADSLLMLCFQLMTDPQSYIGVRQTASSLLRLCLDPEFGGLMQLPRTPFDQPPFASGPSGSNPLVALLALGGIGSSAAHQLHFDGASSESEDGDEPHAELFGSLMGLGGRQRRPPTAAQQAEMDKRKAAERKKKRREIKARIAARQKMVADDAMLHLVYATDAKAMGRLIDLLRAASRQWTMLSSAHGGVTPAQVQSFVQSYPPSLLIDCIDFLSFLALRHSVVFQEFAIHFQVFKLLAAFFPQPTLSPAEQQREKKRADMHADKTMTADKRAHQDQKTEEEGQPTPATNSSSASPSVGEALSAFSPSPSPSPSPPVSGPIAPAPLVFQVPHLDAPTGILCAIMRFLRITLEVDNVFIQPIQSSHLLLRLVELFLHNLRPNLVHSSILEVLTFIDNRRLTPLVGQLVHGNHYVQMAMEATARKKTAKLQAKLEQEAAKEATAKEPQVKHDESHTMMMIDAAPEVDLDGHSTPAPDSSRPRGPPMAVALPGEFIVPILPAAPDHPNTPSSTAPLNLPFFSSAYGISRVSHLSIWPSVFKHLRSRRQRVLARATSDAVTEVNGDSPTMLKRRRALADEGEADADSPASKRAKMHAGSNGAASFSGSELESGSSSLSDDSSEFDTSSTSTSDSDDATEGATGRTSLFGDEDDQTAGGALGEEADPDEEADESDHEYGITRWQREQLQRQNDADESYFDAWSDEPPQAEHKSATTNIAANTPTYRLHQPADDEDVDMFAPTDNAPTPSAAPVAPVASAASGTDSAAEVEAADKRLAEIESRAKAEREQREAADRSATAFLAPKKPLDAFGRAGAAGAPAGSTGTGLLAGPKKSGFSFSLGPTKASTEGGRPAE